MGIKKRIRTSFSSLENEIAVEHSEIIRATWDAQEGSVSIAVMCYASKPAEGEVLEPMALKNFHFPVPAGASLSKEILEQLVLSTEEFKGGEIV